MAAAIEHATSYHNFSALALTHILQRQYPNVVPEPPAPYTNASPEILGALDDVEPSSTRKYTLDQIPQRRKNPMPRKNDPHNPLEALCQLLAELNLTTGAQRLAELLQQAETAHPAYSEFLAQVLKTETDTRWQRKVARRVRWSKLGAEISLDGFDFSARPQPGAPWENGLAESFSSRLRDELLNVERFRTLAEARWFARRQREEYNEKRPHSSLGYAVVVRGGVCSTELRWGIRGAPSAPLGLTLSRFYQGVTLITPGTQNGGTSLPVLTHRLVVAETDVLSDRFVQVLLEPVLFLPADRHELRGLFMPQRFDRIHPGGAARGIRAKD